MFVPYWIEEVSDGSAGGNGVHFIVTRDQSASTDRDSPATEVIEDVGLLKGLIWSFKVKPVTGGGYYSGSRPSRKLALRKIEAATHLLSGAYIFDGPSRRWLAHDPAMPLRIVERSRKENDLGELAVELDVGDHSSAYWIERKETLW